MSLTLLIPKHCCDQLSHRRDANLQPLTPGYDAQQPLTIGELRKQIPADGDIAVSQNPHPPQVDELLSQLQDLRTAANAVIVCSAGMIPETLKNAIPASLHALVSLPAHSDLYYLSRHLIDAADDRGTVRSLALIQKPLCINLSKSPHFSRYPDPGPGSHPADAAQIRQAVISQVSDLRLSSSNSQCLLSGLLLLWNLLEDSHEISQTMEGQGSPRTADYWHAIMHRREPDPPNAVYWFRRVGSHPAFESLGKNLALWMKELGASDELIRMATIRLLRQNLFDPMSMAELSRNSADSKNSIETQLCQIVQYLEMLNLLCWSLQTERAGEHSFADRAID